MHLTQKQARDRPLIRYLAEQVIPEKVNSICPLPEGVTSYNFEINQHIIFKLQGLTTPTGNWIRQSKCAPILQKHLSCKIPQIKISYVFLNSTSQDFIPASSYEKIPGKTIPNSKEFFKKDKKFKVQFFEELSDLAYQLHSISPECLPVKIPTGEQLLKEIFSKGIGKTTPFQEKLLHKIIHSHWTGFNKNLNLSTLCHCDLRSANICLDKQNHIIGILDFDSLNMGEPFLEFRPMLYGSKNCEADTTLFYQTYCTRTGYEDNPENFKRMRRLFLTLCAFSALCKMQNTKGIKETLHFLKKAKQLYEYV